MFTAHPMTASDDSDGDDDIIFLSPPEEVSFSDTQGQGASPILRRLALKRKSTSASRHVKRLRL